MLLYDDLPAPFQLVTGDWQNNSSNDLPPAPFFQTWQKIGGIDHVLAVTWYLNYMRSSFARFLIANHDAQKTAPACFSRRSNIKLL